MPRDIPGQYETFEALTVDDDGATAYLAASPHADTPGFDAYLIPWYVLSDRGTFFVPGAAKRTAKQRMGIAPHLWQHDTWEPIGRHVEAKEDQTGFRISVAVNEATTRGAELMSNLRFGTPLAVSVGFDTIADRTATKDDPIDRRSAPDYLKNVPATELRAITEFRWWESSSVTFPGIGTARPDEVRSRASVDPGSPDALSLLLAAIRAGTLTPEQTADAERLAAAWSEHVAPGPPDPPAPTATEIAEQERRDREHALSILAAVNGLTIEDYLCAA